ncbi:MAG: B12-binding domain-containing radical SAM protein, partial [Chloroflexota bacterium]|nr:B12-binding domain-containing radical SAM protein [Chloroflexota bacterium]
TIHQIKTKFPTIIIIYGGVYPSYADQGIMRECSKIDFIVRGEGEQTIVELIQTLENNTNLEAVEGITWRNGSQIIANRSRAPIQDLDAFRFGWELVDWSLYQMFGFSRAAGLQFSRGCPLTCSYCGQWMFWKKWRHRSPENIVEQLKILSKEYGVNYVWFADENFSADKNTLKRLLELIIAARLDLSLNINMTAADVVRDADIIPLYKAAGIDYMVMGVESLKDQVIVDIRKNNPFATSKEAVRLLRQNNILSLTNIIYGLEQESWGTIREKFKNLLELDSDILNACYIMPHFWTSQGRTVRPSDVIQSDLDKWSYRDQVVATPHLKPFELFLGVKLTEAVFHLRPKALRRIFFGKDKRYLKIMRSSMWAGIRVIIAEIFEFLFRTRFISPGSLEKMPGLETHLPVLK